MGRKITYIKTEEDLQLGEQVRPISKGGVGVGVEDIKNKYYDMLSKIRIKQRKPNEEK